MATLVWDQVGERVYQTGVDRGVLYLHDGTVVVWNGLASVEESSDSELKSFYLDGVKFLENLLPGDFSGRLKAITYPDEFDSVNGIATVGTSPGMAIYNQPAKSFDLSYRTKIGNDLDPEAGYKIHILYNIHANPDLVSFGTTQESVQPTEFAWILSGTPPKLDQFRPTVHISIDSTATSPELMEILENILYGTDSSDPRLPSLQDIAEFFGYLGALIIIDHGNGFWTAVDESDTYITMIDPTNFRIDNADATYSNATTYDISSTNVGAEN
jgi:hypothetical protein